jgi:hypothetical protein
MIGKRSTVTACIGAGLVILSGAARAEDYTAYHWAVDVLPAAVGISLDSDRFNAKGIDRSIPELPTFDKESVSLLSTVPSIALSFDIEKQSFMIDLRAGVGALLNQQVKSPLGFGTVGVMWELKRSIWAGPHVGWAWYTDPEWWGDADIDLDSTDGLMAGLQFVLGDKISYMLCVDYYDATFDVTRVGPEWKVTDDSVDLTNLAVQFGVRAQF